MSLLKSFFSFVGGDKEKSREARLRDASDYIEQVQKCDLFKSLNDSQLEEMFLRMEELKVLKDEVIIREGDQGDYYYLLVKGNVKITRHDPSKGGEKLLVELSAPAGFGEEALISNKVRNATITMLDEGIVMRLSRDNFDKYVKEPFLKWLSPFEMQQQLTVGAVLLDVRTLEQFEAGRLKGAMSMPLCDLRSRLDELNKDGFYICCCDNGKVSSTAAFLLTQFNFNAGVLRGGLENLRMHILSIGKKEVSSRVLVAEKDVGICTVLKKLLQDKGFDVDVVEGVKGAEEALKQTSYGVLIAGADPDSRDDHFFLHHALENQESLSIIALFEREDAENNFDSINLFAGFIKPFNLNALLNNVQKAIDYRSAGEKVDLNLIPEFEYPFKGLAASSESMGEISRKIKRTAGAKMNFIVTGAKGTGKGVVAELIYETSGKRQFDCVNFAENETLDSLPEAPDSERVIYLKNLSSLSSEQQSEILSKLQELSSAGALLIGGLEEETCLKNENLGTLLKNMIIELPSLNKRKEDIIPVVIQELRNVLPEGELPTADRDVIKLLQVYSWPGNVQELCSVVIKMLQAAKGNENHISIQTLKAALGR